jgi:hypothetical protein
VWFLLLVLLSSLSPLLFFSGLCEELANCVGEGIAVPTFPAQLSL